MTSSETLVNTRPSPSKTNASYALIALGITTVWSILNGWLVYFYLPTVLVSLVCYPLITWLSGHFGKWRLYTTSLLISAIALFGLLLVGEWLPVGLKTQGIIWVIIGAITLSGVVVLSPAFAAEITDHDSEVTGQRRERVYYAAWGLLDNTVSGVATALVPIVLLLGRSRSSPHGPLGVRMIGVVAGVMMLIAFFVFRQYPLPHRQAVQPTAGQ